MTARLRLVVLRLRAVLARGFARAYMTLVPPREQALVAGLPDSEENSLVTALALARRFRGRVLLVANDPALARAQLDRVAAVLDAAGGGAAGGGAAGDGAAGGGAAGGGAAGDDAARAGEGAVAGSPGEHARAAGAVVVIGKRERGTYAEFLRSALVAYTHGLYDSPRPAGGRVHVNLWHGSGPKWNANANQSQRIGADVLASSNEPWGREVARALSMPADSRLVTGNPRQDVMLAATDASPSAEPDRSPPAGAGGAALAGAGGAALAGAGGAALAGAGGAALAGAARAQLAALGLDPARPVVLWMPTFRASARAGRLGLREGEPLGALADPVLDSLVAASAEAGVQLVLKTHRHDDDDYARLGLRAVSTEDVLDAGLTLYQLVGFADAMVSDYSSVWVDYLATGRSVALYCPDLATYERERGLNDPPLREVAGGLFLDSPADATEFVADLAAGRVFRPEALAATVAALGAAVGPLESGRSRADAMLDELAGIARERFGSDLRLGGPPSAA